MSFKKGYGIEDLLEGYRTVGSEYSVDASRPDMNESFTYFKANESTTESLGWNNSNELHKLLKFIYPWTEEYAIKLLESTRERVAPHADPIIRSDATYLQINNYTIDSSQREFLQDEHEDGHLLTLVHASEPGLEIKTQDGFVPIVPPKGKLLVMAGSILNLISNGVVPTLFHRVRRHEDVKNRVSMMLFVNPSLDCYPKSWDQNSDISAKDIRDKVIERSVAFGLKSIDSII